MLGAVDQVYAEKTGELNFALLGMDQQGEAVLDAMRCEACGHRLSYFNDDYVPDGAMVWEEGELGKWICPNSACEEFGL